MAEPTVTRADLRRAIGRQMGMRFYRYQASGTISAQSGDRIEDSDFLMQRDSFWNRSWFYAVDGAAAGNSRMVIASRQADRSLQLEFPPSAGMSAADVYEILDFYSAESVHEAVNASLRDAWPSFFETKEDYSLCVSRDLMELDISALSAFMVMQVWIERPDSIGRYDVASATTTSLILDTTADLSTVDTDWWITIYQGTSQGYSKQVATFNNTTKEITWAGALTAAPDTTSKISLFNPLQKNIDWYPAHATDFDNKQWPDKMRFKNAYDNHFLGMRLMIRYITIPSDLSVETSTTAVPIDFVVSRARAYLYDWHKDDTRQDRSRFDSNYTDQMIKSEQIKKDKAFQAPDQLFWLEDDLALSYGMYADPYGDPLGWSRTK
ncbi:MAG: hypothetical protein GQ524_07590 [Anaerolineales bacterium]|nr:hypothetical protein [Anaerolineales bacterium]